MPSHPHPVDHSRRRFNASEEQEMRLFFGMGISAPWPAKFPQGRMIPASCRHATLVFLGESNFSHLSSMLEFMPLPTSTLGIVGLFTQCLFLPPRSPRVVAWKADFLHKQREVGQYQLKLQEWLQNGGFLSDDREKRPWLPHVSLCRAPFESGSWENSFEPLPFFTDQICLYKSEGGLQYTPLWSRSFQKPFRIDIMDSRHRITLQAESPHDFLAHFMTAMAFLHPPLSSLLISLPKIETIEEAADFYSHSAKNLLPKGDSPPPKIISYKILSPLEWEFYAF